MFSHVLELNDSLNLGSYMKTHSHMQSTEIVIDLPTDSENRLDRQARHTEKEIDDLGR